ncbi:MAG TPA: hypothetical protein VMF90_14725 [Rhizobiaceae bacterium]|nr:hypothetical protein [Rhizobiaceae bacterium]
MSRDDVINIEMDPDVKAFRDADGDAVRAELLLTMPVNTLLRYRALFVAMCRRAHFSEGETYVEKMATSMRVRRHLGAVGVWGLDGSKAALMNLVIAKGARS